MDERSRDVERDMAESAKAWISVLHSERAVAKAEARGAVTLLLHEMGIKVRDGDAR